MTRGHGACHFGTTNECAQVTMMLVNDACMTGQIVALSGGLSFL